MPDQTSEKVEVKMYSDFKSPYAYLAFDPGMAPVQLTKYERVINLKTGLRPGSSRSVARY